MASARSRFPAAAAIFVLCALLGAAGAAAGQQTAAYAPVVVTAQGPASAGLVAGGAASPVDTGTPQRGPSAGAAGPGPRADASANSQPVALRVSSGHADNDVHLASAAPASSAGAGKASLHVEDREETNNRIADPRTASPSALASASSSASPSAPATASSVSSSSAPASVSILASDKILATSSSAAPVGNAGISGSTSDAPIISRTSPPPTEDFLSFSSVSINSSNYSAVPSAQTTPDQFVSSGSPNISKQMSPNTNQNSSHMSSNTQSQASNPLQNGSSQPPSQSKNTKTDKGVPYIVEGAFPSGSFDGPSSADTFVPVQGKTETKDVTTEYSQESTVDYLESDTELPTTATDTSQNSEEDTTDNRVEDTTAGGDGGASANASASASDASAHPCARECVSGAPAMRCHYRFEITGYYAMSKACYDCPRRSGDCDLPDCVAADGVPRGMVVVNRQLPGPAIEVCLGDRVVVDLHNGMVAETTSVHWHGHHQRGTPYMDGVPHVTQCPIPPMTTFRYAFTADTPGTHFWHSHTGHQRADGAFGSLVVRVPREEDPHAPLWDRDERAHTLLVLDWGAAGGAERFLAHHHSSGPNKPTALLINGRGRVPPSPLPPSWSARPGDPPVPAPEFSVKQGLRYRFRLINAGFLNCPVELTVDDHDLLVISSDGSDIRPVAAASLVSYAGERFDFVLEANRSVGAYWIRMRGLLDCDDRFNAVHQAAVLRYEGARADEPPGQLSYAAAHRAGNQVNSFNVGSGTQGSTVIPELDALAPDDESLKAEPDYRFYLAYDFYALDNPHFHTAPHYGFFNVTDRRQQTYTPQFNHISMKMPSVPMLPQRHHLDERQFCNTSSLAGAGCEARYCECVHVIQVPLDAVLEIVLIDEGVTYDANHPFHLHGHAFRVVAMERLGNSTSLDEVQRRDAQGLIARKLHAAPLKDTCTVPDGGFTILRVRASNPGYWLFHCHIEFHVEIGMALVFKIGEHAQFPPVPRGFPQCGDWVPSDDTEAVAMHGDAFGENKSDRESDNEVEQTADDDRAPHNGRLRDVPSSAPRRSPVAAAVLALFSILPSVAETFGRR